MPSVSKRGADFFLAFLAGLAATLSAVWVIQERIPTSGYPLDFITPAGVWPMRWFLLVNFAFVSAVGATLVVIAAKLCRRRPAVAAIFVSLVIVALCTPGAMSNQATIEKYRWFLLSFVALSSGIGFWVAFRLAKRFSANRLATVVLTLLSGSAALVAGAAMFWFGANVFLHPAALFLLVLFTQGLALATIRVAQGLVPPPAPRLRWALAAPAVALLAVALLDPAGVLDGIDTARTRRLFSRHGGGFDKLVHLRRSATGEWLKVRGRLLSRPQMARGYDLDRLPDSTAPQNPFNVVLVTIDALRRDRCSAYGYEGKTTPNLERLAAEAFLFERAYSPSPQTGHSIASFMTGLSPQTVARLSRVPLFLPALLRHHGYATTTSFIGRLLQLRGYPSFAHLQLDDIGFDNEIRPEARTFAELDRRMVDGAISELRGETKPRFIYLHFMGTHGPFDRRTGSADYDDAIRVADTHVGRVIDVLKTTEQWDNTVFAVFADHGEGLGEHGMYAHAQALYEEQVAVPLLVHIPGGQPGRVTGLTSLTSIPAMVMDLLGARWPIEAPPGGDYTFQEHHIHDSLVWRSVRRWPYVFHNRLLADVELYRLDYDPGERVNLAQTHPEVIAEFKSIDAEIQRWEWSLAHRINAFSEEKGSSERYAHAAADSR